MNLPGRHGEELFELIGGWCDGALDGEGMLRLERLLNAGAEARRLFLDHMDVHASLSWQLGLRPPVLGRGKDKIGDASSPTPPASTPPVLGFLGDLAHWGESLPGMRMFSWMLVGFVGMLVGLPAILALLAVLGFANRPAAQLVATTNCRWTDAAAAIPASSQLAPGQRIELAAGVAQIVFHRGAVVTLFGPSVLEILSDNSARLVAGKLTARVETKNSHGFAVHTPAMTLVDLGTEFGVLVPRDGVEEVDVFRGHVQVELAGGAWSVAAAGPSDSRDPASPSVQTPNPSTFLLTANQALRVDANQRTVARQAAAWGQFASAIDGWESFPLVGTGVGLNPGQSDPHWMITDVNTEAGFTPRPAVAVTFWSMPEGAREAGQWISLNNEKMPADCRMTFRTEFDLTGLDPATATIDGRFAADDWIASVRLNGKRLPLSSGKPYDLRPFHIGEGFVAGKNVLEMVVENDPALGKTPIGLLVQWKGAARAAVKPEAEK